MHAALRRGLLSSVPLALLLSPANAAEPARSGQQSVQSAAATPAAGPVSPDDIKQRTQQLEDARAAQKSAAEQQAKLQADIASIGQDRSKLNQQLIDVAARVRSIEASMGDTEARLRVLDQREAQMRASLDSRRSDIVEVLAALQRAGRRTPPALLVRPEDALQSLRTAMLLGSLVPELRARAEKISGELGDLLTVRKTISTQRDKLAADRDKLKDDQTRLSALVGERQRQQFTAEKDLEQEGARAIAMSKQADSLQGLISKMEQDLKSAAKAAAIASLQGVPASGGKADTKNATRTSPAIAFASAKGIFALPVNGTKIRDFGASDGVGGTQKGISLATRPGAQVTTPCDGWVVYAGPFRSYGQLLILNAGGGYHVLIAGMERISVNIGQFVLSGEPVATMGSTAQVASILSTNASQPVLYVEFRKDNTPIDSGPWWAASEGEKVRG
nr:peptidoglycan DD-metalloendopeptidase family protein [Bradyrhizobium sp.]